MNSCYNLLEDTLNSQVTYHDQIPESTNPFYSQPTLPTLRLMMLPSDNFLAEQLLINCARTRGFRNVDAFRDQLIKDWDFLPDTVRWVDGSGLSRYNLISPRNIVSILNQIYQNESWETIEQIFPIGGVSGTLKNWYKADKPYVYAKTGTLSKQSQPKRIHQNQIR